MKECLAFVVIISCIFVAGCNKTGTPSEFGAACDVGNDGKYLEVVGYIVDQGNVFCSNAGGDPVTCGFKFVQKLGDDQGFSADIVMGSSADEVEKLPSSYKPEDIKIRDHTGALIKLTDKVKLTGKLSTVKDPSNSANNVCFLTVAKLEKQ
jgi:hypothetical protein